MPNHVLIQRFENESVISSEKYEVTSDMVKRVLYPKYVADETSQRQQMSPPSENKSDGLFDDKTYFQLKVRPEFLTLRYASHEVPVSPITYSSHNGKTMKLGAPEEYSMRYPGDKHVSSTDIMAEKPIQEPEEMSILWEDVSSDSIGDMIDPGDWIEDQPIWTSNESNYFRVRPEFRTYNSVPSRSETDADYSLRPYAESLRYETDNSLRTL